MVIGLWTKRSDNKRMKWHLVESIIDGDVITKCGRRMGGGLWNSTSSSRAQTPDACFYCR